MDEDAPITLGIYVGGEAVEAVSSNGHETVIRTANTEDPGAWLELTVYGVDVEPGGELRAAVTFVRGTTREQEFTLRREARRAGFHRVLVVPALDAARRGLRGGVGRNVPLILLDTERSQLGVGSQHDWVRPIPGREARELAVSLRCLLKPLPPRERRERLERVVVAAPESVLERFGRRGIEEELEAIGAERVEFHEETLALARGALISAARAPETRWRRVSRR